MTYLVDSSCFMTASQTSYPFDIAESFWIKMAELAQDHVFYSIDKVKNEIYTNLDELSNWCKENLPSDFFISTETEAVYERYGELVNWAQSKGIKQSGVNKFIDDTKADIFFIAFCSLSPHKYTVVTEEVPAPQSMRDIKLPDACAVYQIRCIKFVDMLRELKVKF